jgi:hypothetical protein
MDDRCADLAANAKNFDADGRPSRKRRLRRDLRKTRHRRRRADECLIGTDVAKVAHEADRLKVFYATFVVGELPGNGDDRAAFTFGLNTDR